MLTEVTTKLLDMLGTVKKLKRFVPSRYVFVEYGPMELDLNLRVRVHELERYLADKVRHLPSLWFGVFHYGLPLLWKH